MEFCPYGNLHTVGKLCYVCPLSSAEELDKATAGIRIMDLKDQNQIWGSRFCFLFRAI